MHPTKLTLSPQTQTHKQIKAQSRSMPPTKAPLTKPSVPRPTTTPQRPIGPFEHIPRQQNGRYDAIAIKVKLMESLGEKATRYWGQLKKYLIGKLSIGELRDVATNLLTKEQMELHNTLILAIIHNASQKEPPPPDTQANGPWKRKHGFGDDDDDRMASQSDAKRRRLKRLVMSLPREERERIKMLRTQVKERSYHGAFAQSLPHPPIRQKLPVFALPDFVPIPPKHVDDMRPQTCQEMLALPDADALKRRLIHIAQANGLASIQDECVPFMRFALESHLKNILGNAIQKVRTGGSLGISTADFRMNKKLHAAVAVTQKNTLTAHDLAFSFEVSPHILVEPSDARERLTSDVKCGNAKLVRLDYRILNITRNVYTYRTFFSYETL
ncbi:8157_t:CDS:2 [Paraglomus brasilianum]|uniref:8157_t:CDS:1 n=1 Tax=Paraglomus brasilianum TaxID=144538 RepID=A0A9N9BVT2_9GLOM|nr:8157_t:CDS:2 [Paraglomus brasilianum]